jgi:acid stress-induced BolA-like protein IbaG/YrbA
MKSAMFIHNDAKCFHVDVQGTHKLVVMSHVNFEDHALIKRQQA